MIVLLDLNYTLVSNSEEKTKPFTKQIEGETYHTDLIEALRGHRVILVTARTHIHREATLASILQKTGWQPDEAYFNEENLPPPTAKRLVVEKYIRPRYDLADCIAIESNPRTRAMYARFGIPSIIPRKETGQQTIFDISIKEALAGR